ncbi:MAG: dTDP-glucose 4,6-dehydratase [Flavobacteriia bacterium]|nr:dTDP-glucose 4,6-dehydratase [Flavobacteriia bacterium]
MKNILITGGCGFIGSHFILKFLKVNKDYHLVNLDNLTYASNIKYLDEVKDSPKYTFVQGDIVDFELLKDLFLKYQFDSVVHFAAESHVDNSIHSPADFINTNILGTFNLLENAKNLWLNEKFELREGFKKSKFIHISTDEVYGSLGATGLFNEQSSYLPNSPYSASKASSDLLVRSYFHTYGLNINITNCSNNYGPHQHNEKLIPTIIRNAIAQKPIPIYGDGLNVRDWLYVEDHCEAILQLFNKGKIGEKYNIGGNFELTNLEMVNIILEKLDSILPLGNNESYKKYIVFVKDRAGHDRRYAIDSSKIKKELQWSAKTSFDSGIEKTIHYYISLYKR